VRLHVVSKNRIHAGLVAASLRLEKVEDVWIKPKRDLLFGLGKVWNACHESAPVGPSFFLPVDGLTLTSPAVVQRLMIR
jgi:hypothetical protein